MNSTPTNGFNPSATEVEEGALKFVRGLSGIYKFFWQMCKEILHINKKDVQAQQSHWDFGVSATPTDEPNESSSEVEEGTVTFERVGSGITAKFKWTKRKKMFVLRNEDVHDHKMSVTTNPDNGLGVNASKAGVSIGQADAIIEALGALHIGGAGALNVANDSEEADIQVRLKNAHIQMAEGAVIEVQPSVTDIANRSKNAGVSLDRGPIIVKMEENSKLKISSKISVGNDVAENSKVNLKSEGVDITLKQQANVEISQTLNVANEATNANIDIEIGRQTLECEEGATAKLAGGLDAFITAMEQLQSIPDHEEYSNKEDEVQRLREEKTRLSLNLTDLKAISVSIMRQLEEERNKKEAEIRNITVHHAEERRKFSQFVSRLSEKVNILVHVQGKGELNKRELVQVLKQLKSDVDIRALGQECGLDFQVEMRAFQQPVYIPSTLQESCNIL